MDGWHRLFRSVTQGDPALTLPAYLLTEDEAEQILLDRMPGAALPLTPRKEDPFQ